MKKTYKLIAVPDDENDMDRLSKDGHQPLTWLRSTFDRMAGTGWVYEDTIHVTTERPAGCLALIGFRSVETQSEVLVFSQELES
jgi:hypothetical protein